MAYFILHSGQPSAKRLLRQVSRLHQYHSSNEISHSDVLIRWGPSEESDPAEGYVINSQTAVARTVSRTGLGRFLRRVGVRFTQKEAKDPVTGSPIRFLRHYRVPVFDMMPLACFRSDANDVWLDKRLQRVQDSFREVSFSDEKVTTRVLNLATRTLHALGLDCGLVSIGMAPRGILHVLDVVPNPVLEGRMLDLFTNAINDFIDREEWIEQNGIGP
ncbi:MAG: hypothetical protein K6T83_09900, partial [Alicyclobacillus sp.]|nr:hypothetical protein [Alicyclobacillus sp.]